MSLLTACRTGTDTADGTDTDTTDTDTDTDTDTELPDACDGRADGPVCDGDLALTCADGQVVDSEPCPDGCADGACLEACALTWGSGPPPETLRLVTDPGEPSPDHAWRLAPLQVAGVVAIEVAGPFQVVDRDGVPLSGAPPAGEVFLRAVEDGAGEVTFHFDGCDPVVVRLVSGPLPRLAGTVIAEAPGFDDGGVSFLAGRELAVDVPAFAFPERVGSAIDVWLAPHREDGSAPDLADPAALGPFAGQVGVPVSLGAAPNLGAVSRWDVVVDADRDGAPSPGDLVQGADGRAVVVIGNLTGPGPHPVDQADWSGTGQWEKQRIYWPTDLDQLDPMPLVVISHGNGHDYRWYDYLGVHLASHGYVVMSHKNNTVPGPVSASRTTVQNTDAFFDLLPTFQNGMLDGEVDPHAIVWVGHSRGGEGVVLAYHDLLLGDQTAANFTAGDIVLLSSIAPTLFEGPQECDPGETPYHLIAGSSDGDVTGGVEQGLTQYFRIFQGASSERYVTYVQGADHNDFNCCGIEDSLFAPQNGPLIGRPMAQRVSKAYHLALLEATFQGRTELRELFSRDPERLAAFGPDVHLSLQVLPADGDARVVEDFQSRPEPQISSSGGAVTGDVRAPALGPLDDPDRDLTTGEAMNGMSWAEPGDLRPAQGMVVGWAEGEERWLAFELVEADRDLSGLAAVSFRAAQETRHPDTVGLDARLTLSVGLVDGSGREVVVPTAGFGTVPEPYARGASGTGVGWVNEFQTIRLPLSAFLRIDPELDLTDVAEVRLLFGAPYGSPRGRLAIDDLAFPQEVP